MNPQSAHGIAANTFDWRNDNEILMSVTGAIMKQSVDLSAKTVQGFEPLYPLKSIKPTREDLSYNLNIGDTLRVNTIELTALNSERVPYYGFDSSLGKWKLVDEDSNPLPESIATLKTDPMSHNSALTAKGHGKGYIAYEINEDAYTYYNSKTYARNSDIALPNMQMGIKPADLTREDLALILYYIVGKQGITGYTGFDDVDPAETNLAVYNEAIAWACQNGIISGHRIDKFRAKVLVTKEQFITIMYRYVNYMGIDTSAGLTRTLLKESSKTTSAHGRLKPLNGQFQKAGLPKRAWKGCGAISL